MKRLPASALGVAFGTVTMLIIALTTYAPLTLAAEVHVPDDYPAIQTAIDGADEGDVVVVYPGIYYENIHFQDKAITVKSTDPNDPDIVAATIIDGNQVAGVVRFENRGTEENASILSGVTVQNGKADLGGGIYCYYSSPCIINCTIRENRAFLSGGGTYCQFSSPRIINCIISGNSAGNGGGLFFVDSSPAIANCIITGNSASEYGGNSAGKGGGLFFVDSSPAIVNCIITGNSASEYGGGIHSEWGIPFLSEKSRDGLDSILAGQELIRFMRCERRWMPGAGIQLMYASIHSVGFLSGMFVQGKTSICNCIIARNSASYGSGMSFLGIPFLDGGYLGRPMVGEIIAPPFPKPLITNCTITENSASSTGGGIWSQYALPIITDCILWGDSPDEVSEKILKISHSDVQGWYAGIGNINADPLFVDPEAGDYHLQNDSPCMKKDKYQYETGAYGHQVSWRLPSYIDRNARYSRDLNSGDGF